MKIGVFHDTVCPWCRIGKQHLKLALADWDGEPVTVHYRRLFLERDHSTGRCSVWSYMQTKIGGQVPLEQLYAGPRQRGQEVGLIFNFERIEMAPNTTLSHQLIAVAPDDAQEAVVDAVYEAYFVHGRDIGNLDVLVEIATNCGLDEEIIRRRLQAKDGLADVLADVTWAREQGISGVPFFIFNGRYAFSGAQPPQMIRRVLQQVVAEAQAAL